MSIRIVNGGNPVLQITPAFDECIIESEGRSTSFVVNVQQGMPRWKRIRTDEEVSDFIGYLANRNAIGNITVEGHDVVIAIRQLGEDGLEIDDKVLKTLSES